MLTYACKVHIAPSRFCQFHAIFTPLPKIFTTTTCKHGIQGNRRRCVAQGYRMMKIVGHRNSEGISYRDRRSSRVHYCGWHLRSHNPSRHKTSSRGVTDLVNPPTEILEEYFRGYSLASKAYRTQGGKAHNSTESIDRFNHLRNQVERTGRNSSRPRYREDRQRSKSRSSRSSVFCTHFRMTNREISDCWSIKRKENGQRPERNTRRSS